MKLNRAFGVVLGALAVLSGGGVGNVCGQVPLQEFKTLRSLVWEVQAKNPYSGVIEGSDGVLYGASYTGGDGDWGTIYKINKDGSGFRVIKSFSSIGTDGGYPFARLMEGSDGFLYGSMTGRGANGDGTLFKLAKDGSDYAVLHQFSYVAGDGVDCVGALVQGSNGVLYGTAAVGGSSHYGIIFMIHPDGSGYSILHHFSSVAGDGGTPLAGLVLATNNCLYGDTQYGGEYHHGTLFKINLDGSGYSVIKSFSRTDGGGYSPGNGTEMVQGSDGLLYGMTQENDTNSYATVFKIGLDGSDYTVVKQFGRPGALDGNPVFSSITLGGPGRLYVTLSAGEEGVATFDTIYSMNTDGSNLTPLKTFNGDDGSDLRTTLLLARDGALYGTTAAGGTNEQGTIYRLNTDGSGFTVLKHFRARNENDAIEPNAPLLLAGDGVLYGTSVSGGSNDLGTVFKMNRDGSNFSILKSFGGLEGESPMAGLVEGANGALYGTASMGGSNNCGVIFKLNKDGSGYSVLKTFGPAPDAAESDLLDELVPFADPGVTVDSNQVLYGMTPLGGISNLGTIFRINPDGSGFAILKSFTGGADGAYPMAGLLLGLDGALYGTTWKAGDDGLGTVFKIQRDGTGFTVLKSFPAGDNSCALSLGALVQDASGVLYGALHDNANYYDYNSFASRGAVFKLNADGGGYAVIKSFTNNASDGWYPFGLVRGIDGSLYGTTQQGGGGGLGTVFRLSPDGSHFALLKGLSVTDGGGNPSAGLTVSSDGTLYGITANLYGGTVFSLTPAVAMGVPIRTGNYMMIPMATGIPGRTYTVQRTSLLAGPWTALGQTTISVSGVADFKDSNPPEGGAFYRAIYP